MTTEVSNRGPLGYSEHQRARIHRIKLSQTPFASIEVHNDSHGDSRDRSPVTCYVTLKKSVNTRMLSSLQWDSARPRGALNKASTLRDHTGPSTACSIRWLIHGQLGALQFQDLECAIIGK